MSAVDEDLVRDLACTSSGCFAPLTAALGGFVAQEVLKSASGKFTPLHQWVRLAMTPGMDFHSSESCEGHVEHEISRTSLPRESHHCDQETCAT